jgi:hypothetical protein
MSQTDNTIILKAGEIKVKETKRGFEFWSFNFQRQRMLHIGTLKGRTYEKVVTILRQPEPSISLPQSEYGAAVEWGAMFLRAIPSDHSATYAISLRDFKANAVEYYNAFYGPQWRVPLTEFSSISTTAPRNAITDNPVIETKAELLPRQMTLFGG